MQATNLCKTYLTVDRDEADDAVVQAYQKQDHEQLLRCISDQCWEAVREKIRCKFPSRGELLARQLVVSMDIERDAAPVMREMLAGSAYTSLGADLPFASVDHWCPRAAPAHQFGDSAAAKRMIGVEALRDRGLVGEDVNVVIVDQGLDKNAIEQQYNGKFGGGWPVTATNGVVNPGTLKVVRGVSRNEHGMMIARNILAIAPGATVWDLPVVPQRITNIPRFLSDAHVALEDVLADPRVSTGRWLVVNAWAPFDRSSEVPDGDYSNNPKHPFNMLMAKFVERGIDVVFAAGNCGQFRPDRRCGKHDIGPGRSIFGANAHPKVLTVGAITTQGLWLGSASQGEGPNALAATKPDVVAPSMFSECADRHTRNGGTSAACAVAAGVVAALRQEWGQDAVSPELLIKCLRESARQRGSGSWNGRLGYGVINAAEAMMRLAEAAASCSAESRADGTAAG